MKRNLSLFAVQAVAAVLLFTNCTLGLGAAVDTEWPTVSIVSPAQKSFVKDNFTISGEWSDDKELDYIKIQLENLTTKKVYPESAEGYRATINSDGTWTCKIPVLDEKGNKLVADGNYNVLVTAVDLAVPAHETPCQQVVSIDNTAPVLILSSPSSVDINDPATYGKVFSIQGNYSDDTAIDSIIVTVLDETGAEIPGGSTTLRIKGTTIDDNVAIWEATDGLYEKLYGDNISAGTKKYYCKVTIYDSARKVPAVDGDKGNGSSFFLMQSDVEEYFSNTNESPKTTEIYSLLAGTSDGSELDSAYTTLLEDLKKDAGDDRGIKKSKASFSLNPINNPTFSVSGYTSFVPGAEDTSDTELDKYTEDGSTGLYEFKDKSSISITVSPGRDNYSIRKSTLGVKLIECDAAGNAYKDEDGNYKNAFKINLKDDAVSAVGTSYTIETQIKSDDYEGLEIGKYYIIQIEGNDTKNNAVSNGARVYALKWMPSNTTPPALKISSISLVEGEKTSAADSTTSVSIKGGQDIVIEGTAEYYPDILSMSVYFGNPEEDDTLEPVISGSDIVLGDIARVGQKNKRSFKFTIPSALLSTVTEDTFEVYIQAHLNNANQNGSLSLQVTNDTTNPVFAEDYTITPTVEKTVTVDGKAVTTSYVNGKITIETSVSDNITLKPVVSYSWDNGENWTEYGPATKIKLVSVDTTAFTDKADKVLMLKAVDAVGNTGTKEITIHVDQSTDAPTVELSNADSSYTKVSEIAASLGNIFNPTSSNQILGTITDDDGINYIQVIREKVGNDEEPVWSDDVVKTTSQLSVGGKTTYNLKDAFSDSAEEGSYLVKIVVVDSKQDKTGYNSKTVGPFLTALDSGSPAINLTTTSDAFQAANATFDITGTVDDSASTIAVYTDLACTKLYTKDAETKTTGYADSVVWNAVKTGWTITIHTTDIGRTGDEALYICATDIYGQRTRKDFKFKIDAFVPVYTIDTIGGETFSADLHYASRNAIYTIRGTANDGLNADDTKVDSAANSSGLEDYLYVKIVKESEEPFTYTAKSIDSTWEKAAVTAGSTKTDNSSWIANIDFKNYDEGGTYYLYIVARDTAQNVSKAKNKVYLKLDSVTPYVKDYGTTTSGGKVNIWVKASDDYNADGTAITGGGSGIDSVNLIVNDAIQKDADGNNLVPVKSTETIDGKAYKVYTFKEVQGKLQSGTSNTYSVKLTDKAGNSVTPVNKTINNEKPGITLTNKLSDNYRSGEYYYTNKAFTIPYAVSAANNGLSSVTYQINSDAAKAIVIEEGAKSAEGNITVSKPSASVKIDETVTATNIYGDSSTQTLKYIFDLDNPTVSVDSASLPDANTDGNRYFDATKNLTITGSAADASNSTAELNSGLSGVTYSVISGNYSAWDSSWTASTSGMKVFWESATGSGSWKVKLDMTDDAYAEGAYTVFVKAVDNVGNEKSITPVVLYADKNDPVVEITAKPGNYIKENVTISGTLNETYLSSLALTVNGVAASFTSKSATGWSYTLPVSGASGSKKIVVTAIDKVGKKASVDCSTFIDTVAPVFTVSTFNGNAYSSDLIYVSKQGSYTIRGTAKDGTTAAQMKAGSGLEDYLYFKISNKTLAAVNGVYTIDDSWSKAAITAGKTTADESTWIANIDFGDYSEGGQYYIYFAARDAAQNVSKVSASSYVVTVKIDSVNPYVKDYGISTSGGAAAIWAKVSDDYNSDGTAITGGGSGIDSVKLIMNEVVQTVSPVKTTETIDGKSYEVYTFSNIQDKFQAGASNTYTVKVTDKAGNTLTPENKAIDNSKPTVTITNNLKDNYRSGEYYYTNKAFTIPYTVSAANNGLSSVTYQTNSNAANAVAVDEGAASKSGAITVSKPSGSIKIDETITATNIYGAKTEQTLKYIFDIAAPVISITDSSLPSADSDEKRYFDATKNLTLSGTAADSTSATAELNSGLSEVVYSVIKGTYSTWNSSWTASTSGMKVFWESATGSGSWKVKLDMTAASYAEGAYTVFVKAIDNVGNEKSITPVVLYADKNDPVVEISTIPNAYIADDTVITGTLSETYLSALTVTVDGVAKTFDSSSAAAWSYTLPKTIGDGEHTVTVTAVDKVGKKASAECTAFMDTVAPTFDSSTKLGTQTLGALEADTDGKIWFNSTDLTIDGTINESGSGVAKLEYEISNESGKIAASGTIATTDKGSFEIFKSALSSFVNTNISDNSKTLNMLKLTVTDNTGCNTSTQTYYLQIDTVAPVAPSSFNYQFDDGTVNAVENTIIANGKKDLTITGTASDSISGLGKLELYVDSVVSTVTTAQAWSYTIPKATLDALSDTAAHSIKVKVTDNAGNSSESPAISLKLDKEPPVMSITSPKTKADKAKINGKVTFMGKMTETNTPKSLQLYYKVVSTGGTAPASFDAMTTSDSLKKLTSLGGGSADVTELKNWSFELNVSDILNKLATPLTRGDLYIALKAIDEAENESVFAATAFDADLDSDRPVIKLTNLDAPETDAETGTVKTSYLKNSTKLTGSVSDDDGISYIKILNQKTAPTAAQWEAAAKLVPSSGSFSYTLGADSAAAEGAKNLWFYVADTEGGNFITTNSTAITEPKLYYSNMDESKDTALNNNAVISFIVDNSVPEMSVPSYAVYTASPASVTGGTYTEMVNKNILGGIVKKFVSFKIIATDNGSSVSSITASTTVNKAAKTYSFTKNGTTNDWYSPAIDVGKDNSNGFTSDTYVFTFTTTDNAGNTNETTKSIIVDNTAPAAALSSPTEKDLVTGEITLIGMTTDENSTVEAIKYVIGTDTINTPALALAKAQESTYTSVLQSGTTATSWKFDLDGTADGNAKLPASATALTDYSSYETSTGSELYKIPVYLYTKDSLGNEGISSAAIYFNPYGDRPSASVTYPVGDWTNKNYNENYSNISGSIRITGAAEDNESVADGAVYIQLDVNNDGNFDSDDYDILSELDEYKTKLVTDASALTGAGIGYAAVKVSDYSALGTAYKLGTHAENSQTAGFWGLKANGTNSWNYTINTDNELQTPATSIGSSKYKVGIRSIAMDSKGVVGKWSSSSYFMIDLNAPSFDSDAKIYTNPDDEDEIPATYEDDMYLNGTKSLQVTIRDLSGLKSVKYTYASSLEDINSSDKSAEAVLIPLADDAKGNKVYKVNIPLSTMASTLKTDCVALKVVATKDSDTETTSYEKYIVYFDNTAPEIKNLTLNSVKYDDDSDNKIVNSNGYFTIGGQASDAGAGFERMSFYFMRDAGTTITEQRLYDPEIAPDDDITDSKSQPNYVALSGLVKQTVTAGSGTSAKSYDMYGAVHSLSVNSSTLTVPTDSSTGKSIDIPAAHIRAGGYAAIGGTYDSTAKTYKGGTWHKIKEVETGTKDSVEIIKSITLEKATTATGTVNVYFPYIQSIDNTGTEKSDGAGGVTSGDDGDKMPESIIKSQTTWSYDASFFSNYIPDGPGYLITFVYDKAGNVTAEKYKVTIQNKAPRLTKLWLATDLNNSGTFQDKDDTTEVIEYNVLNKVGEQTNYTSMSTADYRGTRFIVKDQLAVIPEFTNGNGDIYMALNNAAEKNLNRTALSSTTYKTQAAAIKALYKSDAAKVPGLSTLTKARTDDNVYAYVIPNTAVGESSYDSESKKFKDRALSFTFWDSTEDTISGVNSNYCYLRISDLVVNVVDEVGPNVVVDKFFWNSHEDNSLYQNSYKNGHIELEDSTEGNPDVSGIISIRGSAFDDHTLSSIWVKFDGFTPSAPHTVTATESADKDSEYYGKTTGTVVSVYNGDADSDGYYKVASYENGKWTSYANPDNETSPYTVGGSKWAFKVNKGYLGQAGHKVTWQLDIDTSVIDGAMGNGKLVSVRAKDAASHTSSETPNVNSDYGDDEYNKPSYEMDVVPYINKVQLVHNASLNTTTNKYEVSTSTTYEDANRSRLGHYSVQAGAVIALSGFNFGTGTVEATKTTGTGSSATKENTWINNATRIDENTVILKAPDYSGFVNLSITGAVKMTTPNNTNKNEKYNIQEGYVASEASTYGADAASKNGTNFWNDDVYLSVWSNTARNGSVNPWDGTVRKLRTAESKDDKFYANKSGNSVDEIGSSLDTWFAAWSSPNMMILDEMGNKAFNYHRTLYQKSQAAFLSPVETMDMTIVGGIPWYVFNDNYVGNPSANLWGAGLIVAREGYDFPKDTFNGGSITESEQLNVIERQGDGASADSRKSATGYDSVLNQFQNPKITGWYDATSVTMDDGLGSKTYDGTNYIYVSYYDSFSHCLKYAAFSEAWSKAEVGGKWGNVNGTKNFKSLARASTSMTAPTTVVAGVDRLYTASDFSTENGEEAGEWSDIMVDPSTHVPVIIYYNKTKGTLEIAKGKNAAPSTANYKTASGAFTDTTVGTNGWTKIKGITPVSGHDFGRYVSAEMDRNGNIHAAAQDFTTGALYYIFLAKKGNSYTATYKLIDSEISASIWTDITLDNDVSTNTAWYDYKPIISYIDQSKKTPKIACVETVGTAKYFDAVSDAYVYEAKDKKTSVMGSVYESTTSSNKAKAAIGFNSDMLCIDFLRDEL